MYKKFLKVFLLVLLPLSLLNLSAKNLKPLQPTKFDEAISNVVKRFMVLQHFSHKEVNDSLSAILFHDYFLKLDPSKYFFYQEDIDRFKDYKYNLDNAFDAKNLDFAYQVFDVFEKRLEERLDYVKTRLKVPFDFTKEESLDFDRKDVAWVKTKSEMDELWRKRVKNNLLLYKIIAESLNKKEKNGKLTTKEAKKIKNDKLFNHKDPIARVLKYYDQIKSIYAEYSPNDVLEKYLDTFTGIYDPHSNYMGSKTLEDFNIQMSLSLQGIGATLTQEDGFIKITKVVKGGPAYKDGRLKSGDRIIAVGQNEHESLDVIDMPLRNAVTKIRGKKGTKVFLTIIKGDKGLGSTPVIIDIVRDEVKINSSAAKGIIKEVGKNKIGIIAIPSFYADFNARGKDTKKAKFLTNDVKEIIKDFNAKNVDGMIIDLRSNGGGSLSEAIKLTGLFFDNGPVVQVADMSKKSDVKWDRDDKTYFSKPLLVITNGFSASASEIFAGAIQDYGRGVIVGDKQTHGKGTVQTMFDLKNVFGPDNNPGALKFTIQKFYRITGESTQKKGVIPDIIFPSYLDQMVIHESSLPHVLKYDKISVANYKRAKNDVQKYITNLRKKSLSRIDSDKDFQKLEKDVIIFKEEIENKKISLNKKEREKKKEQDEGALKLKTTLIAGMNGSDDDENKYIVNDDLYMRESLNIISDLINDQK